MHVHTVIALGVVFCQFFCLTEFISTGEEGTGMKVVKRDSDRPLVAPASTIAEEAVDQLQASEKLIAGEYVA